MQERDIALRAASRRSVDQLDAFARELIDRPGQVVDGEADVMHRGAAALVEEARDAGSRVDRLHQLDERVAHREEGDTDALLGDVLNGARLESQPIAVERELLVDVPDHDRDVMQVADLHLVRPGAYVPNTPRRSVQISPR